MGDVKQCERETVPLRCGVNKNGGVDGAVIEASVLDPTTGLWLNFGTGAWQASEDKQTMAVGVKPWLRTIAADLSQVPVNSHRLFAFYEASGVTEGDDFDELIMGTNVHAVAGEADQDLILQDTGTSLPATLASIASDGDTRSVLISTRATAAEQTAMQASIDALVEPPTVTDIVDGVWDEPKATHTDPNTFGDFLDAKVSIAGGSGLDAAGVRAALGVSAPNLDTQLGDIDAKIVDVDTVVDAILVQTTAGGPGPWLTGTGGLDAAATRAALGMAAANLDTQLGTKASQASVNTMQGNVTNILADTDAIEQLVTPNLDAAISSRLADGAVDLSPAAVIAIWAKVRSSETWGAGSFGEFLDALVSTAGGGTLTVQDIVDGVWDEVLPGNHSTVNTAGAILQGAGSGGVDYGLLEAAVWGATAADWLGAGTMGSVLNGAGAGNTPEIVAAAVWAQTAGGAVGTFGNLLDANVSLMATTIGLGALDTKIDDILEDTGTDIPARFDTVDLDLEGLALGVAATASAAELALVDGKVDDILEDTGSTLPTTLSGKASQASVDLKASQASVTAIAGTLGTKASQASVDTKATAVALTAVDAKVDNVLSEGGTGPWTQGGGLDAAGVRGAVGMSIANLDAQLLEKATAAELAIVGGKVDTVISTGGDGPWTQGGAVTLDPQDVRDAMLLAATGGEVAIDTKLNNIFVELANKALEATLAVVDGKADAMIATGGPGPWTTGAGGSPTVYSQAVWGALKATFNDPDTMGEVMNQLDLGELDTSSIVEAINAGVSLVLNQMGAEGACPGSGMILGNTYTGHKGDQLILPVFRNGTLMIGVEFENATQLSIEINNITDDTQLDIITGVNKGPEGYFVYTTREGDGAFETRGKWEYQVSGLDGLGAPFVSQRLTVRVFDDVA